MEINWYDPSSKIVNHREIAITFRSIQGPHTLKTSPSGREWIEASNQSRLQFRSAETHKPSYSAERTRERDRPKRRNLAVPEFAYIHCVITGNGTPPEAIRRVNTSNSSLR